MKRRRHPSAAARRAQSRYEAAEARLANSIARQLRAAMRGAGLDSAALAARTGYTTRTIDRVLRGSEWGDDGTVLDAGDTPLATIVALFLTCGLQLDFSIYPRTPRAKTAAAIRALREGA